MELLGVFKELHCRDGKTTSGHIERMYAEKGEDGVYHTRYRYKVTVKPKDYDLVVSCMLNNTFHSNSGPAIFTITDGDSEDEKYFLSSGGLNRKEWLKRRNRLQKEPYDDMLEELLVEMGI